MQEKINIKDESGDKKYFTIIPNYVLNHSVMWDREVYVQMKRITGEDGTCWTSRNTLAKQCGMSVRRLDKSITYLVKHSWIKNIGKKEVITKGGVQEVNEYQIADLWKLNVDYYENLKGGAPETPPQGGARTESKVVHGDIKGGAHGAYKEEPVLIRTIVKEEPTFLSEFENVLLKENELEKLKIKFGEKNAFILIEELGGYLASTGKKYNSHYATLLNWGRRKIQDYKKQSNTRSIASINQ